MMDQLKVRIRTRLFCNNSSDGNASQRTTRPRRKVDWGLISSPFSFASICFLALVAMVVPLFSSSNIIGNSKIATVAEAAWPFPPAAMLHPSAWFGVHLIEDTFTILGGIYRSSRPNQNTSIVSSVVVSFTPSEATWQQTLALPDRICGVSFSFPSTIITSSDPTKAIYLSVIFFSYAASFIQATSLGNHQAVWIYTVPSATSKSPFIAQCDGVLSRPRMEAVFVSSGLYMFTIGGVDPSTKKAVPSLEYRVKCCRLYEDCAGMSNRTDATVWKRVPFPKGILSIRRGAAESFPSSANKTIVLFGGLTANETLYPGCTDAVVRLRIDVVKGSMHILECIRGGELPLGNVSGVARTFDMIFGRLGDGSLLEVHANGGAVSYTTDRPTYSGAMLAVVSGSVVGMGGFTAYDPNAALTSPLTNAANIIFDSSPIANNFNVFFLPQVLPVGVVVGTLACQTDSTFCQTVNEGLTLSTSLTCDPPLSVLDKTLFVQRNNSRVDILINSDAFFMGQMVTLCLTVKSCVSPEERYRDNFAGCQQLGYRENCLLKGHCTVQGRVPPFVRYCCPDRVGDPFLQPLVPHSYVVSGKSPQPTPTPTSPPPTAPSHTVVDQSLIAGLRQLLKDEPGLFIALTSGLVFLTSLSIIFCALVYQLCRSRPMHEDSEGEDAPKGESASYWKSSRRHGLNDSSEDGTSTTSGGSQGSNGSKKGQRANAAVISNSGALQGHSHRRRQHNSNAAKRSSDNSRSASDNLQHAFYTEASAGRASRSLGKRNSTRALSCASSSSSSDDDMANEAQRGVAEGEALLLSAAQISRRNSSDRGKQHSRSHHHRGGSRRSTSRSPPNTDVKSKPYAPPTLPMMPDASTTSITSANGAGQRLAPATNSSESTVSPPTSGTANSSDAPPTSGPAIIVALTFSSDTPLSAAQRVGGNAEDKERPQTDLLNMATTVRHNNSDIIRGGGGNRLVPTPQQRVDVVVGGGGGGGSTTTSTSRRNTPLLMSVVDSESAGVGTSGSGGVIMPMSRGGGGGSGSPVYGAEDANPSDMLLRPGSGSIVSGGGHDIIPAARRSVGTDLSMEETSSATATAGPSNTLGKYTISDRLHCSPDRKTYVFRGYLSSDLAACEDGGGLLGRSKQQRGGNSNKQHHQQQNLAGSMDANVAAAVASSPLQPLHKRFPHLTSYALKVILCHTEADRAEAVGEYGRLKKYQQHAGVAKVVDYFIQWPDHNAFAASSSASTHNFNSSNNNNNRLSPTSNPPRSATGTASAAIDIASLLRGCPCFVCIVTHFYKGSDLHNYIRLYPEPIIPEGLAVKVIAQLANTVGYLHQLHPAIAHRNLRTENVLVDTRRHRVVLGDFGKATEVSAVVVVVPSPDHRLNTSVTANGSNSVVGGGIFASFTNNNSSAFPSPSAAAPTNATKEDDILSLGLIAYCIATRKSMRSAVGDYSQGVHAYLSRIQHHHHHSDGSSSKEKAVGGCDAPFHLPLPPAHHTPADDALLLPTVADEEFPAPFVPIHATTAAAEEDPLLLGKQILSQTHPFLALHQQHEGGGGGSGDGSAATALLPNDFLTMRANMRHCSPPFIAMAMRLMHPIPSERPDAQEVIRLCLDVFPRFSDAQFVEN